MNSGTTSRQFRPSTIVAEALALHPKARWVLAAYHIRGCGDCDEARRETLEEVAGGYGIALDRLLSDLNALLESGSSASEPPACADGRVDVVRTEDVDPGDVGKVVAVDR